MELKLPSGKVVQMRSIKEISKELEIETSEIIETDETIIDKELMDHALSFIPMNVAKKMDLTDKESIVKAMLQFASEMHYIMLNTCSCIAPVTTKEKREDGEFGDYCWNCHKFIK